MTEEAKTETGGMDFDQVREFVAEHVRVKELDAELKHAKADLEELKQAILDRFAEAGVGSIKVDGKNVYTHRQLWAGKAQATAGDGTPAVDVKGKAIVVENDDYIAAIKAAGLDEFVKETVNSSTLSSWVREIEEEDADGLPVLPPPLVGFVKVTEKFDVRVRKG